MKYIEKGKEPDSLRDLRNTDGATYEGPQSDWQTALLKEQGHICAYCMGRISTDRLEGKPKMEIEHYLSRELYGDKSYSLNWRNMLGVCNGHSGNKPHCDKAIGEKNKNQEFIRGKFHGDVQLKILNPIEKANSEDRIEYSITGRIKSKSANPDVDEDLNIRLNLNDPKLVQFRKDAIDRAKQQLIKQYPIKQYPNKRWSQNDIDKEIAFWQSRHDGKYQPYCQAAIWFLEWLKSKPKYQ